MKGWVRTSVSGNNRERKRQTALKKKKCNQTFSEKYNNFFPLF